MIYTDNPVKDAERYYEQLEQAAAELPKCDYCGKPLDDYYNINGEILCSECLDDNFRHFVDME